MTETTYAALKLVRILPKLDERTQERIYGYTQALPPAAFFSVRAGIAEDRKKGRGRQIRDEVAYALGSLSAMCLEGQYASG